MDKVKVKLLPNGDVKIIDYKYDYGYDDDNDDHYHTATVTLRE